MSVDYTLQMGIGWKLDEEQSKAFFKQYNQEISPEVSHMEDRFNPKTGEKLNPKLVIDEEAEYGYAVDGKEVGLDEESLMIALNDKVKGFYFDLVYSGSSGDPLVVIFLDLKPVEEGKTSIDCNEETFLEFYVPASLVTTVIYDQLDKMLPFMTFSFPTLIGAISIS